MITIQGLVAVQNRLVKMTGAVRKAEYDAVEWGRLAVERAARQRVNFRGKYSPEFLHVRSSALIKSLNSTPPHDEGFEYTARVGFRRGATELPGGGSYAVVHEYGATIRPVNASVLAIPLSNALRAKSGTKGEAAFKGPRSVPDGHWFISPKSGRLLFASKTRGILFVGVKEVKIPARAPLRKALASQRQKIAQRHAQFVKQALRTR